MKIDLIIWIEILARMSRMSLLIPIWSSHFNSLDTSCLTRYLFWGDWGTEPKIERSRLDGSNRTTIIDLDIAWPNGLTIDYEESRLYWCEAKHDVIYSADFDGNNIVKVVDKVGIQDPFSITVFNEHIYWTDR